MPNSGAGFADLLVADGVIPLLPAFAKDAALKALARAAGDRLGTPWLMIHERLHIREQLGATGFGGGAAIPHARLPGLSGCVALVARLPQPIDWQATDGEPVDVLVLLLSPESAGADHLKALARISRTLRDPRTMPALRTADTAADMMAALAPVTATV
ncbi:PTS sugar transporter subunit IIA [Sandarakinorhabdus rubra]|uniref:PTS sugar transporter subunit IIA n=1 Tax=Sandarakinorhabdus rubra TaxID=2672568 RepID=UPI0013D9443B|nr:PTS sugar transporter subunit IIA [Sandarakinorhabdus rubra]